MTLIVPGVLSSTELTEIVTGKAPCITSDAEHGIDVRKQIQPSSIDLTLGNMVYGMFRTALPKEGQTVLDILKGCEYSFPRSDGKKAFLHHNYSYIIPLRESVHLPKGFTAKFSPKSSIGRIDVFVRVLADGVPLFDYLPDGYNGPLYLEVTPLSFRVNVSPGESLVQMRLKMKDPRLSSEEVRIRQSRDVIFRNKDGSPILVHELRGSQHGVYMHVDLDRDIVGFASRSSAPPLLLQKDGEGLHEPYDYWEPLMRPRSGTLDLEPGRFYLLATKERVTIPPDLCGDIMPYDASAGEFRSHYAGFFDPGFGGPEGTTGVLEVRGRESVHGITDDQPICLMIFERLASVPESGYAGNYNGDPRPSLSKYFKDRWKVWE